MYNLPHDFKDDDVFDTPVSVFRRRDDGVIHILMKSNVEVDIDVSVKNAVAHRELAGGERLPFLIEVGAGSTMTKEARDFHGLSQHSEYRLAEAIVSKELAQRIMLKFYSTFYKRNHPVKIFKTRDEAEEWLAEIKRAAGI